MDLLDSGEDSESQSALFDGNIHVGSVQKCRNLPMLHKMFSNAYSLSLDIISNPKLEADLRFENLQDLTIRKEMFALEFQLIHDFLRSCPRLKKFKVEATSLHHYD